MIAKGRSGRLLSAALAGLLFSGGLAAGPDNRLLPVKQACLISADKAVPISIEIASTSDQRSRGLMQRQTLAADAGMLFVYTSERGATNSFWMYQTLIPLDIAYLGPDGTIRAINQMQPCPSDQGRDCPNYPAGVPFYQALEMNQGYFEDLGLDVGDRLSLNPADCR